jgi:hypothetical protein
MIIKLLIIILLIILFLLFITYQLEGFSNKNYTNTNINKEFYPYSQLPYDITVKDKTNNIYDFGNDELNELFNKLFKINFSKIVSLTEGINWSKWVQLNDINNSSRLYHYYSNVIEDFTKQLKNPELIINQTQYTLITSNLNKYKVSTDNNNIYLLDINAIIYRPNRPLAKDVKIIAICNGIYTNFLLVKVIGVIQECQIKSSKISDFDLTSYNNYNDFIPSEYISYDMNSFIYDTNDKLANSQAQYNLYNKLFKDLK